VNDGKRCDERKKGAGEKYRQTIKKEAGRIPPLR
jgi:hypothetical protein